MKAWAALSARGAWVTVLWAGLWLLALPVHAHKASDAYARVIDGGASSEAGQLRLQLSIAVKDLDAALPSLDADNDRAITWGEVRQALPEVMRWVGGGLTLACGTQPLGVQWVFEAMEQRADGAYVRLAASTACDPAQRLTLDYRLMKGLDPTHRLLLTGDVQGKPLVAVLAPQGRSAVALRAGDGEPGQASTSASPAGGGGAAGAGMPILPQSGPAILWHFMPEGVHHIATGYDHLAFLLALLLPIVLGARRASAGPDALHRPGLARLLTTVTGFTVGHSVTLVLATLGWISTPGWVEPAIAITIAISALLNLYPVRGLRSDVLALGFGLVHGLGFSSIMREAGVSGPLLPWALAGFNLGVEAGQLVGVAVWCALHLVLARWPLYDRVVVRGGSWALLTLAVYWAWQRF